MNVARTKGKNHSREQIYAALKKELAKKEVTEGSIKLSKELKRIVAKKMNRKVRYFDGEMPLKGKAYRKIGSATLKEVGIC